MRAPAHTQVLETLVEAHARELHLPAIRTRFRLAAEATGEQQTALAYLATPTQTGSRPEEGPVEMPARGPHTRDSVATDTPDP